MEWMYQTHKKERRQQRGVKEKRGMGGSAVNLNIMSYFPPKQTVRLSKRKLIWACVKRVAIAPQGMSAAKYGTWNIYYVILLPERGTIPPVNDTRKQNTNKPIRWRNIVFLQILHRHKLTNVVSRLLWLIPMQMLLARHRLPSLAGVSTETGGLCWPSHNQSFYQSVNPVNHWKRRLLYRKILVICLDAVGKYYFYISGNNIFFVLSK